MVVLPLLLALFVAAPVDPDGPKAAARLVVSVDRLDVYAEIDDHGFTTSQLKSGTPVEVKQSLPNGWLAIAPPRNEILWVDADAVDELRDGRLFVHVESTPLRLGRANLPQPGPLKTTIREGTVLLPANVPSIESRKGRTRHTWLAVKLGPDEVRFVRAAGIHDPSLSDAAAPAPPPAERTAAITPGDLPVEVSGPLKKIDDRHRAAVSRPVPEWNLEPIKRDYQTLLASLNDSPAAKPVRERLEDVSQEDELAKAARDFETLMRKSRKRDVEIEKIKEGLRELREDDELAFDAEGLLQATARQVDGEKVFSLLNEDGLTVTYLRIPPGVDTHNLVARRVGVRGKSRFDDTIKYRLLDVRDIEALDRSR